MPNEPDKPIGYLIPPKEYESGYGVGCFECVATGELGTEEQLGAKIYASNVKPYRQNCCRCGKVLVDGGKNWPQLFERVPKGDV